MAEFLMPENTVVAPVNGEANSGASPLGTGAVRRGPIGDIALVDGALIAANYGDDTVALINPHTLGVSALIAVPGEPVAVVTRDDRAYVSTSSFNTDAVSVIDTAAGAVLATYALAYSVTALAVSPDGKRVYAGRTGDDHVDVAVIDTTAERVGTIDIAGGAGAGIDALAVDATGKRLYVATSEAEGSALVVVNLETAAVERRLRIGAPIRGLALDGATAYVLTSDRVRGGVVHVVDVAGGAVADRIELGTGAPTQLMLAAGDTRAYIVDYDRVMVLSTASRRVVDTITVSARPSCIAVDAVGGHAYVADYSGVVTRFAVPATPMLYSDFVATDPIHVPDALELLPASV